MTSSLPSLAVPFTWIHPSAKGCRESPGLHTSTLSCPLVWPWLVPPQETHRLSPSTTSLFARTLPTWELPRLYPFDTSCTTNMALVGKHTKDSQPMPWKTTIHTHPESQNYQAHIVYRGVVPTQSHTFKTGRSSPFT